MINAATQIRIIVADDDADDRLLIGDALKEARLLNDVEFVEDGQELLDCLRGHGRFADNPYTSYPGLVLLDLNMPRKDGREALKEIKEDPELRRIPIVVFTTSKTEEDIFRTYDLGVNSFISKPVRFSDLVDIIAKTTSYWLDIVSLPPDSSAPA